MREKVYDDDTEEEIDVFDLEVSALVRNCIQGKQRIYTV